MQSVAVIQWRICRSWEEDTKVQYASKWDRRRTFVKGKLLEFSRKSGVTGPSGEMGRYGTWCSTITHGARQTALFAVLISCAPLVWPRITAHPRVEWQLARLHPASTTPAEIVTPPRPGNASFENPAHLFQHIVSDRMTESVVHQIEPVDVDESDAERRMCAAHAREPRSGKDKDALCSADAAAKQGKDH